MRRWIAQGMPYGNGDEPHVVAIDVFPEQRRLQKSDSQQLAVVATYSDGTTEDITRAAVYESNDGRDGGSHARRSGSSFKAWSVTSL